MKHLFVVLVVLGLATACTKREEAPPVEAAPAEVATPADATASPSPAE